jgi:hypothetical protein
MPELSDPPDAPEPGATRTKPRELLNQPVVLLPTGIRTAHDKVKNEDFEVVDCHFWTLDRSGVVADGETGISWWRAREQLRGMLGQYVACRPVQGDDNSISLARLAGAAREVAAKAIAGLSAPLVEEVPADDQWDHEEDPF